MSWQCHPLMHSIVWKLGEQYLEQAALFKNLGVIISKVGFKLEVPIRALKIASAIARLSGWIKKSDSDQTSTSTGYITFPVCMQVLSSHSRLTRGKTRNMEIWYLSGSHYKQGVQEQNYSAHWLAWWLSCYDQEKIERIRPHNKNIRACRSNLTG